MRIQTLIAAFIFSGFIYESECCFPILSCPFSISTLCGHTHSLETIFESAFGKDADPSSIDDLNMDVGSEKKSICQSLSGNARINIIAKTTAGIRSALTYVKNYIDSINDINIALALSMMKGVDDAHGGKLQQSFPLTEMALRVCNNLNGTIDTRYCEVGLTKGNWHGVREKSIAAAVINEERMVVKYENLGNEKDSVNAGILDKCQIELVTQCEQSANCKALYYSTNPESQYMLSHQQLHRMMTDALDCDALRYLKDDKIENRLCAKMYSEAQLISHLKFPGNLKDLFLEHVGFCGYKGYENFHRDDWLEEILTWQSKSGLGCFSMTSSIATNSQRQTDSDGIQAVDIKEECDTHFTTVGIIALAGFYDHFERDCK